MPTTTTKNKEDSDMIMCPHCGEISNIGGLIGPTTDDCPKCGKRVLPRNKQEDALMRLCNTIDATGGIVEFKDGTCAPVGDTEWIDLGDAYMAACDALDRKPVTQPDPDE